MERRKFLIGMGSLAAGGAAAIGTGAFTSVTATRSVDVKVADDANAYLRLQGTGGNNSDYVTDDGVDGTLSIDLDPGNSNNITGGGEGVNPDAVTKIDNLFVIENQGTQEVDVSIDKPGKNSDHVEFYPKGNAYSGDSFDQTPVTLGAGDSVVVYVKVDTTGSGLGKGDELLDSVTFKATA